MHIDRRPHFCGIPAGHMTSGIVTSSFRRYNKFVSEFLRSDRR